MKCPHCQNEIPGITCPECGSVSPEEAKYCMGCGGLLMSAEERSPEDEGGFDLEDRVLCADGACTGIIVNGRCTECGRTPEEAKAAESEETAEAEETADPAAQ